MGIKKTLGRIVFSGILALAGCGNNQVRKAASLGDMEYFGIVSGDFNGDGEDDIAFIKLNRKDITLYAKNHSLNSIIQSGNPEVDWDKSYSKNKPLKLIVIDSDEDATDSKVLEKYLMDFVGSGN